MIDDRRVPNAPDESSAASTRGLPRAPSPNATSPASSPAATTAMRHSASAAAPLLITRPRSLLVALATTEQRGQSKKLFLFRRLAKSVIEICITSPRRFVCSEKRRRAGAPPALGTQPSAWTADGTSHPNVMAEDPARVVQPSLRDDDPAVRRSRVRHPRPRLSLPPAPFRRLFFAKCVAECSPPHLPVSTMPLRPASSAPGRSPPTTSPRRTTPRTTSSRRTSGNSSSASPTCTFS